MIYKVFRDFLTSFGLSVLWRRLQRPHSGAILVLLALFIPIVLGGVKYSQYRFEKRQKSIESLTDPNDATLYKECAREIALAVAKVWNPTKTLGEQQEAAYAIAKDIYNSYPCLQKGGIRSAIPGLISTTSGGDKIELSPSKKQFSYPADTGKDYVKISVASDPANCGKIKVITDYQTAYATPAQCNANVVLAIPVNSDASISNISSVCKTFLEKLCNTQGVCVALIPYSGKLQLPSDKSGWLTTFPPFSEEDNQLQLIGACLYGTTAMHKCDLTTSGYSWGSPYPIMFRRGEIETYHESEYCKGNLLSNEDPNGDDTAKKYLKMNLNPCTTTSASLLGVSCTSGRTSASISDKNCMLEPTFDLKSIADACGSLKSVSSGNKSSFTFAALEWANNFFQTWTGDPEKNAITGDGDTAILGYQKKSSSNRPKVVILLVNKPDYFENGELTYLGFKNDWDEVSKIELEKLTFNSTSTVDQTLESPTGFIKFSGKVVCNTATNCTITCIRKRLVILTVEASSGIGTIKFTNIGATTDSVQNNTSYDVATSREFFIKPEQITANDKTIRFTATNLKMVSAEITNKVCNGGVNATCELAEHTSSSAVINTNCKRVMKLKVTPTKLTVNAVQKSYVQFGNGARKEITGEEKIFLGSQSANVSYKLENAKITKTELKIPQTKFEDVSNEVYRRQFGGDSSRYSETVTKGLDSNAYKLVVESQREIDSYSMLHIYKASDSGSPTFQFNLNNKCQSEEWSKGSTNWNTHVNSGGEFKCYVFVDMDPSDTITLRITEYTRKEVTSDPRYTNPTWDGSKINLAGESGELTVWVTPELTVTGTPEITSDEQKSYVQFGNSARREITGEEKIFLGSQSANVSYKLENAKITKTELKIPQTKFEDASNEVYRRQFGGDSSRYSETVTKGLNSNAYKLLVESQREIDSYSMLHIYKASDSGSPTFQFNSNSSKHKSEEWSKGSTNWNTHVNGGGEFKCYVFVDMDPSDTITLKVTEYTRKEVAGDPRYTNPTWDGSKINLGGESGELTVWVMPELTVTVTPKITYTRANQTGSDSKDIGSSQSVTVFPGLYTKEAGTEQTITIDPNTYYYEPQSDGTYKIKLTLQDIWAVGTPELTDSMKIFLKTDPSVTMREETGNTALRNNDATKDRADETEAIKTLSGEAYKKLGNDTTVFLVQYKKKNTDNYSYIGVPESNIYEADENNLAEKLDEIWEKIKNLAGYSNAKIVP